MEKNGKGLLLEQLSDIFENRKSPLPYHHDLVSLPWKGIITTNYDELLEDAVKETGIRKHSLVFFGCGMRDERLIGWLRELGKDKKEYLMPSCCVMTRGDWQDISQEERDLLLERNIKPLLLENHGQIPELISYLSRKIPSSKPEKGFTFRVDFNEDKNEWSKIIQEVDLKVGDSPVNRMAAFLHILLQQGLEIVVYLDNMESLLEGVEDGDTKAFGKWRDPECKALWGVLAARSEEKLLVVVTCRYTNPDFNRYVTPISHLSWDAVLRMTPWFPGLRRLSPQARIRLTEKLSGHPRAVEYLNDIIVSALGTWKK